MMPKSNRNLRRQMKKMKSDHQMFQKERETTMTKKEIKDQKETTMMMTEMMIMHPNHPDRLENAKLVMMQTIRRKNQGQLPKLTNAKLVMMQIIRRKNQEQLPKLTNAKQRTYLRR